MSSMSDHSRSVMSWTTFPEGEAIPALLTSTSTVPNRSSAWSTASAHCWASRTSTAAVTVAAPARSHRVAVWSNWPDDPSG